MGTHYDILKVTEDAPQEVIRAAYRALSLKYHPDKTSDDPRALRIMQRLNEAYDILSDENKRADYDGELHRLRHPSPPVIHEKAAPRRHHAQPFRPRPAWLKASLLFCSDARVVFPVVVLIWWLVFRLLVRA